MRFLLVGWDVLSITCGAPYDIRSLLTYVGSHHVHKVNDDVFPALFLLWVQRTSWSSSSHHVVPSCALRWLRVDPDIRRPVLVLLLLILFSMPGQLQCCLSVLSWWGPIRGALLELRLALDPPLRAT